MNNNIKETDAALVKSLKKSLVEFFF
jgi:hypothetical protein